MTEICGVVMMASFYPICPSRQVEKETPSHLGPVSPKTARPLEIHRDQTWLAETGHIRHLTYLGLTTLRDSYYAFTDTIEMYN
jgi:hypothetical protein